MFSWITWWNPPSSSGIRMPGVRFYKYSVPVLSLMLSDHQFGFIFLNKVHSGCQFLPLYTKQDCPGPFQHLFLLKHTLSHSHTLISYSFVLSARMWVSFLVRLHIRATDLFQLSLVCRYMSCLILLNNDWNISFNISTNHHNSFERHGG